jgi:hypothetical protein
VAPTVKLTVYLFPIRFLRSVMNPFPPCRPLTRVNCPRLKGRVVRANAVRL